MVNMVLEHVDPVFFFLVELRNELCTHSCDSEPVPMDHLQVK